MENPLLAFVHVPKTGGTSILGALQDSGKRFAVINSPGTAREFLAMPREEQLDHYAVIGHMPFGIHYYADRPVNYAVFLRHPVERALSTYEHNMRNPDEPGAEIYRQMGLSAWARRPSNFMCRFLAYHEFLDEPDAHGAFWQNKGAPDFAPRTYLDQAMEHLEKCAFVGLQETFEADMRALAFLPGQPLPVASVPRLNTSRGGLKREDLHPELVEAMIAANNLDLELYQFALQLRRERGGPLRDKKANEEAQPALIGAP
jgi:hypothetical protein